MIGTIWNLILVNPLLNLLMGFYHLFNSNMGLAIIALSLFVKTITVPFTKSSILAMQRQKELMPELDKLKKKYGHDKNKLAAEQMALYKKMGINPASGCLTQIFPILVIIALFSAINTIFGTNKSSIADLNNRMYFDFLRLPLTAFINSSFLYMDLSKPDHLFILPILSAIAQFVTSKMMMPAVKKGEEIAKKTDDSKDDVMYNMQEQMLYMAPIMSLIIGLKLPTGVVLNILVTTLFSMVQQYMVAGPGALSTLFTFRKK